MKCKSHNLILSCKVLALALMFLIPAMPAKAANLKLDIYLVWASNDEKVPNSKFKKLNEEMANKLKKIFKWKYYFEINKQNGEVQSRSTKKFNVSKKCDIEITEMEGPKVEVKLFGEGKLINRTIKSLTKDELFTIAGEDKNETAWFVIIKLLEEK